MTLQMLDRLESLGPKRVQGTAQSELPLRLLLIRDSGGELPWIVQTIKQALAPVDLVVVTNLGNALWRLGRERFDTVLLDLARSERGAVTFCRRHIADVAAVPVLDLHQDGQASTKPARSAEPPRQRRGPRVPQQAEPRVSLWPPRAGRSKTPRSQPAPARSAMVAAE